MIMGARSWAVSLVLVGILCGCATAGSAGGPSGQDRSVITLAEIEATEARNAFEIVQQLRPRWTIRNRGQRSINESQADFARVMLDDLPPREFDSLHEIPREAILEIRYLEPREATFLYGTGFNAGIVKVTTKGQGRPAPVG